jgi:hypothetical protein
MLSLGALILQITLLEPAGVREEVTPFCRRPFLVVSDTPEVVVACRQVGRRMSAWRVVGLESVRVGKGWLAGGEVDFATLHVRPGDMVEAEVRAGAARKRLRFDVESWERIERELGREWERLRERVGSESWACLQPQFRSLAKRGMFNRVCGESALARTERKGDVFPWCGGYDLLRHLRAILRMQRRILEKLEDRKPR